MLVLVVVALAVLTVVEMLVSDSVIVETSVAVETSVGAIKVVVSSTGLVMTPAEGVLVMLTTIVEV